MGEVRAGTQAGAEAGTAEEGTAEEGTAEALCLLACFQAHIQFPSLYLPEPHARVLHCPHQKGPPASVDNKENATETLLQAN